MGMKYPYAIMGFPFLRIQMAHLGGLFGAQFCGERSRWAETRPDIGDRAISGTCFIFTMYLRVCVGGWGALYIPRETPICSGGRKYTNCNISRTVRHGDLQRPECPISKLRYKGVRINWEMAQLQSAINLAPECAAMQYSA